MAYYRTPPRHNEIPLMEPIGLFATPKTQDELQAMLDCYTGEQRVIAYIAMGITWNYLAQEINKGIVKTNQGESHDLSSHDETSR